MDEENIDELIDSEAQSNSVEELEPQLSPANVWMAAQLSMRLCLISRSVSQCNLVSHS